MPGDFNVSRHFYNVNDYPHFYQYKFMGLKPISLFQHIIRWLKPTAIDIAHICYPLPSVLTDGLEGLNEQWALAPLRGHMILTP